ncbi:MAG: hypothetical protein K0U78_19660 [Actinomycetia bacterium]|nr:hypothetical protein [Actinomycetes bacterium]
MDMDDQLKDPMQFLQNHPDFPQLNAILRDIGAISEDPAAMQRHVESIINPDLLTALAMGRAVLALKGGGVTENVGEKVAPMTAAAWAEAFIIGVEYQKRNADAQ